MTGQLCCLVVCEKELAFSLYSVYNKPVNKIS